MFLQVKEVKMNIFYLHHDPLTCARMHCDKHVVKMILEYSMMLSTAHHECDGTPSIDCYKSAYKNHPSTIWARQNYFNYDWLHTLLLHLSKEYTHRYKKIHATERKGIVKNLSNRPYELPRGESNTVMPQCMPSQYKNEDCSITAYRDYYVGDKSRFAVWTNRNIPQWYSDRISDG